MLMRLKSRKAVGPDFLVSILLLGLIGLGGVFFLNVFVNGLAMHGVIAIIDSETDQRCFFILLPILGEEYLRAGTNLSRAGMDDFMPIQNFYGGHSNLSEQSVVIDRKISDLNIILTGSDFARNISYIRVYVASRDRSNFLRNETMEYMKENNLPITQYCLMPVYSPVGIEGLAELFMSERIKTGDGV